jgi:type I restriction enzyme, S subunit
MIKQNYLDKLLKGVEVEWKAMGEVCGFQNGFAFKSRLFKDNGLPIIRIANINGNNIDLKNAKYFNPSDYKENIQNYEVNKGDILIAMSGATTGKIGFYDYKYTAYLNQRVGKFVPNIAFLNNRYLYHFLLTKVEEIYILAGGGAQPNLSSINLMKKIQIPIPPLKVQEEIVRILDAFTELTAELTAKLTVELTARKKQYEYYRDKLFTFDEVEVECKRLGDVGEFTRGKRFVKTDMLSEGFPCIHYGEMYTHYNIWAEKTKSFVSHDLASKLRVADHGDVVIVAAGETIEDIGKGTAWLGNTGVVIHDACFSYRSSLNPKYVSYFLRTKQFHDQIKKHISSGKISAINANGLSKAKIPTPPLEEQARIVSILDKFDVLSSSITKGLPHEIDLRRKQYEYYRNMILSFPKKVVEK